MSLPLKEISNSWDNYGGMKVEECVVSHGKGVARCKRGNAFWPKKNILCKVTKEWLSLDFFENCELFTVTREKGQEGIKSFHAMLRMSFTLFLNCPLR